VNKIFDVGCTLAVIASAASGNDIAIRVVFLRPRKDMFNEVVILIKFC